MIVIAKGSLTNLVYQTDGTSIVVAQFSLADSEHQHDICQTKLHIVDTRLALSANVRRIHAVVVPLVIGDTTFALISVQKREEHLVAIAITTCHRHTDIHTLVPVFIASIVE